MDILTLLGSPRKRGSTHAVLSQFELLAAKSHTVNRITVVEHDIRGCRGCEHCQKIFDQPGCAQKDAAGAIFERILAANLLVYASPLYAWDFTAQMKALFDRHYCLLKWNSQPYFSLMQGKRAALLVTCGDGVENNADLIQIIFKRQMACLQTEVAGSYILPHCTLEKARGVEGAQLANQMASELLI
jgi:multimeric flavodoxin WrbA